MRMPGSLAAPRRMSQANLGGKSAPTAADTQAALLQCQKLEAQVQLWKVGKGNDTDTAVDGLG